MPLAPPPPISARLVSDFVCVCVFIMFIIYIIYMSMYDPVSIRVYIIYVVLTTHDVFIVLRHVLSMRGLLYKQELQR